MTVACDDVFHARVQQHLDDGGARRAGAVEHDLDIADFLADYLERVQERGGHDDGRAVLVVVEDGDVELLFESLLDLEAVGRLDILEVDAAEGRGDEAHRLDDLFGGFRVDADGEGVDPAKALEQHGLALHDGQ